MVDTSLAQLDEKYIAIRDVTISRLHLLLLGWKRFWFVLDGRLLTYYKSKSEYESLSACCGSVNVGIATNVSPIKSTKGYPLQIVTRTQIYYLRAGGKAELDRWLIAIQEAATIPPNISLPYRADPGVQFYRYSFTALSQWSLEASTEDLSSLHNLQQNLYRPTSLLKKCHSFVALNFNLNKTSWKNNKYPNYNNHSDLLSQSYNTYHSTLGYKSSILESSPQAGELRRELARKLSTPISVQRWKDEGSPKAFLGTIQNHSSSPHLRQQPFGNIYTNCQTTSEQHEYDEILDLNHGIYEPCGTDVTENSTEGIYENVDGRPGLAYGSKLSQDPWEKLSFNKDPVVVTSGSDPYRNRQNRESTERNSLLSISEIPEKQSTVLAGRIHHSFDVGACTDISDKTSDKDSDSTSNCSGDGKQKRKNTRLSKRNSITGFFHKIFTKDRKRKDTEGKDMVITGPVDLRKIQRDGQVTRVTESRSSLNSETQENIKPSRLPSQVRGFKPAVGSNINSTEDLLLELNKKMGERRRSSCQESDLDFFDTCHSDRNGEQIVVQKPAQPLQTLTTTDQAAPVKIISKIAQSNPDSAEYLHKLARFNRLSASLNPSFIAALGYSTCGVAPNNFTKIARSHSCRVRSVEDPPMLPPKQKQVQKLSEYDVPQNNSPVHRRELCRNTTRSTATSPGLRELTKKHSAPDISFSSATPTCHGSSHGNSLLVRSLESTETVFHDHNPPRSQRTISFKTCERQRKINLAPQTPPRPSKSERHCSSLRASQIANWERKPEVLHLAWSGNETDCRDYVNVPVEEILPTSEKIPEHDKPTNKLTPLKSYTFISEGKSFIREHLPRTTKSTAPMTDCSQDKDREVTILKDPTVIKSSFADISKSGASVKDPVEDIVYICKSDDTKLCAKAANAVSVMSSVVSQQEQPVDKCEIQLSCEKEECSPENAIDEKEDDQNVCLMSRVFTKCGITDEPTLAKNGELEQLVVGCPRTVSMSTGLLADILEIPEMVRIVSSSESPTISNKSGDMDNLEVLSDISSELCELSNEVSDSERAGTERPASLLICLPPNLDIQQVLVLNSVGEEPSLTQTNVELANQDRKPVSPAKLCPITETDTDDGTHFYDNVPFENAENLKISYATSNSVQWETVQETEEEIYEMYDEFPVDNFTVPLLQTALPVTFEEALGSAGFERQNSVCHSGMDQLRDFLVEETDSADHRMKTCETTPDFNMKQWRGAVNRLGHSSAVEHLKQIAACQPDSK
ncbi:unnamed protein product [Allacma fusca]|uniref:PH domain-containing protein n=1 Tax=Allacma fusca TaxID=39272 RepID=A0A8J2PS54_9HEXA|nr:unnamed protein product [Allacma fusca]